MNILFSTVKFKDKWNYVMSSSARKWLFLRHHWRCFFFKSGEKHTLFKKCEDGSKLNSNISESPYQGKLKLRREAQS